MTSPLVALPLCPSELVLDKPKAVPRAYILAIGRYLSKLERPLFLVVQLLLHDLSPRVRSLLHGHQPHFLTGL